MIQSMMGAGYLHRAARTGKGQLEWEPKQVWEPRDYYVWDYEGSKGFSNFLTGCLIVGMLVCTCFPIWPHFLKVYLWYLSVTFLLFMSVFCTVRMLLFLNLWVLGYECWILPNLFDESLTFVESFKPTHARPRGIFLRRLAADARGRDADSPWSRGAAAAATRIVRGDGSHGRDADSPWSRGGRPRPRRG